MNLNETIGSTISSSNFFINKLAVAIAIFIFGLIIGKIVGKLVRKFLKNLKIDNYAKKHSLIKFSIERFFEGVVSIIIYISFFIIALNYLGITSFLLNALSIIIVLVIFLSLLFSIKDSIPNIFAYRIINKQLKKGDKISFDNLDGKIESISLLETIVKNRNEDTIYIPNRLFLKKVFTKKGVRRRKKQPK